MFTVEVNIQECPDPGELTNGNKSAAAPYKHGDKIVYNCDDGYELEGDATIQCVNGEFNKPVPTCIPLSS